MIIIIIIIIILIIIIIIIIIITIADLLAQLAAVLPHLIQRLPGLRHLPDEHGLVLGRHCLSTFVVFICLVLVCLLSIYLDCVICYVCYVYCLHVCAFASLSRLNAAAPCSAASRRRRAGLRPSRRPSRRRCRRAPPCLVRLPIISISSIIS